MGVESGHTLEYGVLPGPGAVIANKYRVDRVIATGGMGTILAATHLTLRQRVAIKVLLPEVAGKPEFVERFLREARAAVNLRGEHAVRVFDVGTLESGSPYMVMEYLRGHDLASEVSKRGPLPVEEAVDYVLQACEALAEAHRLGIVHRDLKPANLFLARQPDGSRRVKVLDFGISKRIHGDELAGDFGLTLASTLLGSPQYMSPEQVRNVKTLDGRADIWALGVVLYELLTDATPFTGDTVSAIAASIVADQPYPLEKLRPDVPAALVMIVYRCLEKAPQDRFTDVADLVEALLPFAPEHARPSLDRVRNIARGPGTNLSDSDYPSADSIPLDSSSPLPLPEAETVAMPSARPWRPSSAPLESIAVERSTLASTPVGGSATNARNRLNLVALALAVVGLLLFALFALRSRAPEANADQSVPARELEPPKPAPVVRTLPPREPEPARVAPPEPAPISERAAPSRIERTKRRTEPTPEVAAPPPVTLETTALESPPPAPRNDPLDDRK